MGCGAACLQLTSAFRRMAVKLHSPKGAYFSLFVDGVRVV